MSYSKRLILVHLAAIFTILFCLSIDECMAQRGRPVPSDTSTVITDSARDAVGNARLERRRRFPTASTTQSTQPGITDVPAPRKGPLDVNTLKYAFIDPKTHTVTFVGKYDPTYNTGPIPYTDILKDSLDNPYPSFSLDPTAQEQAKFEQMDKVISADISRMDDPNYCNQWAQNMLNLLLYDTSLQEDNKRFFMNFGAAAGMTGDELKRMYEAAAGKIQIPVTEVFQLASKLMRGVGAPVAADGLAAFMAGGTPEDLLRNMAIAMGLSSQYDELVKKGLSGDQFKTELIILTMSEMCRQFETPQNRIQSVVSSIRSGSQAADVIVDLMSEQMSSFITNKAGTKMVNGVVMGPQLMSRMYNLPVPQSDLVFKNVAPDSALGNILFKADYRLKSICAFPDARDKVSAHLTSQEFMQKEGMAQNFEMPAGLGVGMGHRLVPADVKMRVSPDGNVVEFQDSNVKVVGWVLSIPDNANSATKDFISKMAPNYADYLTEQYDDYAKVYPEWHKMSEAAKVVALARWAKKNDYTMNVENASNTKFTQPQQVAGFWSAVFQVNGDKAYLTVVEEGGASFSQDEGEEWIKPQQDVTVTSDVLKQLVASTVLAEQAVNSAVSGDLEAARDLSEKSARAMTGEIDLTQLPSLDGVPVPGEPASYAAASAEVIDQASECLKKMDEAQKELARAGQLAATSPDEAAKITQQATQAQDEAQAKLKQLLGSVSTYKTDPSKAGDVVVALHGSSGVVTPTGGTASPGGQVAQGTTVNTTVTKPEDWPTKSAKLAAELEEVNKKIAATQEVLRKLNSSIQADAKLFEEWEKSADDGFDRCVGVAADVAIDFSAGALAERYETIHDLAKKLPDEPKDLIEKYRLLASLSKRLQEAKASNDLNGLAQRENKTDTEIYESLRDGIGQISGLLGLDKTVPGAFWKYGSLAADMAYNLTELRQLWKNTKTLEENNARYAEAVKKLTAMMQDLIARQKELKLKIEAGEPVENLVK